MFPGYFSSLLLLFHQWSSPEPYLLKDWVSKEPSVYYKHRWWKEDCRSFSSLTFNSTPTAKSCVRVLKAYYFLTELPQTKPSTIGEPNQSLLAFGLPLLSQVRISIPLLSTYVSLAFVPVLLTSILWLLIRIHQTTSCAVGSSHLKLYTSIPVCLLFWFFCLLSFIILFTQILEYVLS